MFFTEHPLWADVILIVLAVSSAIGFVSLLIVEFIGDSSKEDRKSSTAAANQISMLREQISKQEKNTVLLEKKKERYRYETFHDSLTKLPNRKKYLSHLEEWFKEQKRDNKFGFTVLSVDLNRFKVINESLGHTLGDTLILQVSERLRNSIRQRDCVARFGGDQFGILLHNVSKIEDVTACVEIIVKNLNEPFAIDSHEIFASARVGIAIGNDTYENPEEVLRDADIAMDKAKATEREYVIYNPSMQTNAVNQLQIETDLRYAVERKEFVTFYQPIVSLSDMKLVGFEALIRWQHPERGMVPPGEFIEVAEDTNMIIPMTLWILQDACERIVEWNRHQPEGEDLLISVNLSGKHFAQEDLVKQVKAIIKDTGMNPQKLKLELTESAIMDNAESAIFMLNRLRDVGAQLSIDDFGTGYSSLSYLHRFPIDTLKVDRSFVSTMEDSSENGEIVRTVLALAKALKLDVIAEGIETVHQLHQLRILDCGYGQGYLFSKPVPYEKACEMVADKSRWKNILPDACRQKAMKNQCKDSRSVQPSQLPANQDSIQDVAPIEPRLQVPRQNAGVQNNGHENINHPKPSPNPSQPVNPPNGNQQPKNLTVQSHVVQYEGAVEQIQLEEDLLRKNQNSRKDEEQRAKLPPSISDGGNNNSDVPLLEF